MWSFSAAALRLTFPGLFRSCAAKNMAGIDILRYAHDENFRGGFLVSTANDPRVADALQALGAGQLTTGNYTVYSLGFPELPRLGVTLFSGVAKDRSEIITGPSLRHSPPDGPGEWATVALSSESAIVQSDIMGTTPLFHGRGFISNRLHLIAIALQAKGDFQWNTDAVLSNLLIENVFNLQIAVWQTPVAGVSLLPARAKVKVSDEIRVEARPLSIEQISQEEYHALIAKGAEDVTKNVEAALNRGGTLTSAITAGRDSRVVLAALVALGRVDEVSFRTLDIGHDVDIGSGLLKKFGGKYRNHGSRRFAVTDIEDNFEDFNSHYFFCKHNLVGSLLQTSLPLPTTTVIQLGGGSGELYRSFYQGTAFPSVGLQEPFSPEGMRALLRSAGFHHSCFGERHLKRIAPLYRKTFRELDGDTFAQKLDAHYLNFRNRFHFGSSVNRPPVITWSPVVSDALLAASWGLPWEVRSSGRVMFDVTRYLCEDLAYSAYDKPGPDFSQIAYHRPGPLDGQTIDVVSDRAGWMRSETIDASQRLKGNFKNSDPVDKIFAELPALMERIKSGPFAEYANDEVVKKMPFLYRKRSGNIHKWFSVLSLLDRIAAA